MDYICFNKVQKISQNEINKNYQALHLKTGATFKFSGRLSVNVCQNPNSMKKFFTLTLFALTLMVITGNLTSCGKSGDTISKITVVDANNLPVGGATVRVVGRDSNGDEGGRIDMESTTDASGVATFNFNDLFKRGAAGFAVLDIEVTSSAGSGTGIIKVEEETTSEATVTVQ